MFSNMAVTEPICDHAAEGSTSPQRLLNHIVDDIARTTPEKLYAELPLSSISFKDGFYKVSYRDFSNAINGII